MCNPIIFIDDSWSGKTELLGFWNPNCICSNTCWSDASNGEAWLLTGQCLNACACVLKAPWAAFWGHNTRHWSCFSEEDSIGILKHIARHVSGKQCEGYIIKVAQLRPDFRKLKLYIDICMKDPWISLQFCSFGQVESCWETHEEEPLCAVHMFDHFCMQVCSQTALVYVLFLNFCAGLMWMRHGSGDDRPRVEKVSGERLFKWSGLTCT